MGLFSGIGHALGNVGSAIKKGVTDTGHFIGQAQNNPLVKGLEAGGLALTGVGAPAAAALLGGAGALGGALRPGGGIKGALTGGVQGALTGGAAGLAGDALHGGLSLGSIGSVAGKIPGALSGAAGLAGKALGGAGGGLSLGSLVDPVLGGAAALNAANLQKQSTQYATNAMDTANKSYDARAPLRAAGIAGMQNPGAGIDLSSLKRIGGRNSFS